MNFEDLFPEGLYVVHALDLLGPVAVYVLGMSVYAVFIFRFYRFLAARDMFALDLTRYEKSRRRFVRRVFGVVMYVARYLIVFPLFAFFWFAVLTLILAFLAKDRSFADTLLIALATVSAIRVTAYYDEDLSRDLAKILPFAVLAIFLIDASFFEIGESLSILERANDHRETILYYLLFLVLLEFALRIVRAVLRGIFRRGKRAQPAPAAGSPPEPPQDEEPSTVEDDAADGAGGPTAGTPTGERPPA